jgi:hypothetical protein
MTESRPDLAESIDMSTAVFTLSAVNAPALAAYWKGARRTLAGIAR